MVMFIMLAHGIAEWVNGEREQNYRVMVLVVLAATAITIKLSSLAFSAVIIGFALAYTWKTSRPHLKGVFRMLLPATMLILVWGVRGFMLSGAPLYPSTIGYMPVEWAVPIDKIVDEANWVKSWARQPGIGGNDVLNGWTWLRPWLFNIFTYYTTPIVYPLILTAVFCICAVTIGRLKKARRPHYLEWAILLPSSVALIYWFFYRPWSKVCARNFLFGLNIFNPSISFIHTGDY